MTIKELLVLFKFDVDSPSFNNAQALLSRLEQMAQELEGLRPMGKDKFEGFNDLEQFKAKKEAERSASEAAEEND